MADEAIISYSEDIVVKVRHNQEVFVELASQGPQGPDGEKGDTGDITPELEQAKLDAQAAATAAAGARDTAVGAKDTATVKADEAASSAALALASKTAALTSEANAKESETASKAAETSAKTSETNAAASNTEAGNARSASEVARAASETARTDAQSARSDAIAARDAAQTAKTGAETAQSGAVTARNQASSYADAAKASAEAAALYDPSSIAYQRQASTPAGTNLNTLVTNGVWFFENPADITTALNFPVAGQPGRLIGDKSLDGQRLYQDYQVHANILLRYRRYSTNGGATWSGWQPDFNAGTYATIAQAEAEAGSATTVRWWTAQRVRQAIAAYAATKTHAHEIAEINGLQAQLDAFIASPAFTGTPTVPTKAPSDRSLAIANTEYVRQALDEMIGAAPGTLDTLQEIADALGDDPNFAATMTQALAGKADAGHTHAMADITGLVAAINGLAPKASPALTGTPTAPTAAAATNNTQLATTAHVKLAIAASGLAATGHQHVIADVTGLQAALDAKAASSHTHVAADITDLAALLNAKAPLASPALTGTPTAPTQAVGNNSTRIATTAFVTTAVQNGTSGKADTVHTHAISDVTSLQAALDAKLNLTGGSLGGVLTNSAEFRSTSQNSYRFVSGDYGIFQRFDGSNWYLMLTDSGDQNGAYNSLRPLRVSATTGAVAIGNGLSVAGAFSTTGTATFSSGASFAGNVTGSGVADFARFYGTNSDSAAAPSFTNAADLNTGLWFPGADSIGFTTGGSNRMTLAGNTLSLNGPGSVAIEIGRTDGTASTPVLDFHSGATATDYDARIIASGGSGTAGGGSLSFTCATATYTGAVTAVSFSGSGASLTSLNASNISSGTLADARIPSLAISKITNLQTTLDGKLSTSGKAASATTADQLGGVVAANWLRRDIDQQMVGSLLTRPINQNANQNDDGGNLRIQNASGTGDSAVAAMTFLCQGQYGIKMHLRADGYFGLGGWSRPAWSWYTSPSGDMVSAGNVGAYSDPRLKDDVAEIDNALDIVQQLRGVRFTWNGKTKLIGRPGERDIGVLADEVEAVLPEIVSLSIPDEQNDGEQWRVVAYDKLTPVLIQAIKELRAEVTALKAGASG
ncbi:Phage tail repeat like [Rhizobium sp. AN5]|uniref:phage tail fiber protein n=1 Tax=Rhizobium sp. AN5 TaxID=1855304 RepID=UPI000BD85E3C|nr:tail fiber domain-containing protein [Rhizobium sp. AN5]SOC90135.1 Phage tail repeat like [Rhizobium sp. AN5]